MDRPHSPAAASPAIQTGTSQPGPGLRSAILGLFVAAQGGNLFARARPFSANACASGRPPRRLPAYHGRINDLSACARLSDVACRHARLAVALYSTAAASPLAADLAALIPGESPSNNNSAAQLLDTQPHPGDRLATGCPRCPAPISRSLVHVVADHQPRIPRPYLTVSLLRHNPSYLPKLCLVCTPGHSTSDLPGRLILASNFVGHLDFRPFSSPPLRTHYVL